MIGRAQTVTELLAAVIRMVVRLLTATWEPSVAFAAFGIKLAIVLVPLLFVFRSTVVSRLSTDSYRPWDGRDTLRALGAVVGMFYYLSNIDSAYWVIERVLTPVDTGVIARAAQPSLEVSTPVLSLVVLGILAPMIVMLLLIGMLRGVLIVAVLPTLIPILTLLWVCRIPGLSEDCASLLRRLRWVVFSGLAATAVLSIGTNGLSLVLSSGEGVANGVVPLLCVLGMLVVSGVTMVQVIRYGPRIDRTIDRLFSKTTPGTGERNHLNADTQFSDD